MLNVKGNDVLGGFAGLLNPPDYSRKQNSSESDNGIFLFWVGNLGFSLPTARWYFRQGIDHKEVGRHGQNINTNNVELELTRL